MESKKQNEGAPSATELGRAIDEIRLEVEFLSGALVALYDRVAKLIDEEVATPEQKLEAYRQALAIRYLDKQQQEHFKAHTDKKTNKKLYKYNS